MASLGRAAALLALLTLVLAGAAAPAAESHGRACGAAFDVLRRCAAAGQSREDVRSRCCSLLDAYAANGCLW